MADDPTKHDDPKATEPGEGDDPKATEPGAQGTPGDGGDGGQLLDKHGEPAINKARYDRDIKAKDDRIAELEKQLEAANGKADEGKTALEKVTELEAKLADEKVSGALKLAGCVNEKAAKALLDDYEGDVAKLKEACPYLFQQKQTGSTGTKAGGAPDPSDDEALDRAFGIKK